jgi:hypothetical protein
MTITKARDLEIGDTFRLHVHGQVLAVESVADGKRMRIKIELEDQGRRRNSGTLTNGPSRAAIEFTDNGHVLEFLCRPGREFQVKDDWWDGDDDDAEPCPENDNPPPSILEPTS